MWYWIFGAWVVGSISLYAYVYCTAKEAPQQECVECKMSECSACPYEEQATSLTQKRAA